MLRSVAIVAVVTRPLSLVSASSEMWTSQFKSKINVLPTPSATCNVCFYEESNFTGAEFCIGKRQNDCSKANPIAAPGTIQSIKFGKECDLVVNVRLTEVPFNERVVSISTDVKSTGYNVTASQYSVQEVYVEEAGSACFLGVPETGTGYGVCYTDDVPIVEDKYRNSLTELMLFKTEAKDFDVIVYENDNYNSPETNPYQQDASMLGLEQRFTGYSKSLETSAIDASSGMNQTMQNKVRSIKFASKEKDASVKAGLVVPPSSNV